MGETLMETVEEFLNRVNINNNRMRAWIEAQTDEGEKEVKRGGIVVSGTLVWKNGKILKPTWISAELVPRYRINGKLTTMKEIEELETIRVVKDIVQTVYLEYATNDVVWRGEEDTRERYPRVVEYEGKVYLRVEV